MDEICELLEEVCRLAESRCVHKLNENSYRVNSKGSIYLVQREGKRLRCNCVDFQLKTYCVHALAVRASMPKPPKYMKLTKEERLKFGRALLTMMVRIRRIIHLMKQRLEEDELESHIIHRGIKRMD